MLKNKKTYSKEELTEAIRASSSWAGVHRELSLSASGSSYKLIQKQAKEWNIDSSHFTGQRWDRKDFAKTCKTWGGKSPIEDILIENSTYKSSKLKKRLVNENILEDVCVKCGQRNEWNGESLVLQLDHVDGDSTNNKLENLRILCPNCHSQTPTFSGRNKRPMV